jgi:hypothetical protein
MPEYGVIDLQLGQRRMPSVAVSPISTLHARNDGVDVNNNRPDDDDPADPAVNAGHGREHPVLGSPWLLPGVEGDLPHGHHDFACAGEKDANDQRADEDRSRSPKTR